MNLNIQQIVKVLLAISPLIWMLVSLGILKMPAYKASTIAFILTALIAVSIFNMSIISSLQASFEGIMLALFPIIWVIISALFVYNLTVETGNMDVIKQMLSGISQDRRVQTLIIAFAFGGFLEAVAGFGTAVAIPAGIMIAMGFQPVLAATVCLIANTIPVAFGVLGIPVITLAQVTSLSVTKLSLYIALQLLPFAVFLPMVLIFVITGSVKKIKGVIGVCIISGLAFAGGQTITAIYIGPELAAVVGSIVALIAIVVWVKISPIKVVWRFDNELQVKETELQNNKEANNESLSMKKSFVAWAPYISILVIILATRFLPILNFLNHYPFVIKKQFYFGVEGKALLFQLATSGGSVLFISAIIGGLVQGATIGKIIKTLINTIKQIKKTILTVLSIVALAKIMGYSGMVSLISSSVAYLSGGFYPLIAPLIGALGTFITGSDTSSNILFGSLQKNTAIQLHVSQEWLVAANGSGATAGKMISPQSISIATAATDLSGKEGEILGKTFKYCIVYVVLMGILVYLFSFK